MINNIDYLVFLKNIDCDRTQHLELETHKEMSCQTLSIEHKIVSDTATFIILRFFAICMVGMWCSHALAYEMQFLKFLVGRHWPKLVSISSTGEE
jgi:hypothetical protein